MSGHSKWNNIKRKKDASDSARAKIFTKVAREISVAVREGGPDPGSNGKLRDCIAKAKAANMPSDNIDRCIRKAAGSGNRDSFESVIYEGYGPGGVAVIVETLTDNRNRTASSVRHAFDKSGGNLGQNGCVSFLFTRKGQIVVDNADGGLDEEQVLEDCFDCGAEDIDFDEDSILVYADAGRLREVREALEKKGYAFESAEPTYVPSSTVPIRDPETREKMERLIDMLEDDDDVQGVWHNWEDED